MEKDIHKYDDIINLPHPTSSRHPRMPLSDRAAQFSPFAALSGHEAAIKETARVTDSKVELSDDMINLLNEKLSIIAENPGSVATITYFVPDDKKSGGKYVSCSGVVRSVDVYGHRVIMEDKTVITIDQIIEIESEIF